jgi:hypothetical protein
MGISKGIGSREVIFEQPQLNTLSTTVRLLFTSPMTQFKSGFPIMVDSRKETNYLTNNIKPI